MFSGGFSAMRSMSLVNRRSAFFAKNTTFWRNIGEFGFGTMRSIVLERLAEFGMVAIFNLEIMRCFPADSRRQGQCHLLIGSWHFLLNIQFFEEILVNFSFGTIKWIVLEVLVEFGMVGFCNLEVMRCFFSEFLAIRSMSHVNWVFR